MWARRTSFWRPSAKRRAGIGGSRNGILIRPVKHGVPHDTHGFALLAKEAIKKAGIEDAGNCGIAVGITFDAKGARKKIQSIINGKLKPALCVVLPQAYGTLVSCGKKHGTVINIGHGTTEIIHIGAGGIEGTSIDKASEFVTMQLAKKAKREAYLNYKSLFEEEPVQTAKLSELLARHIADEVSRMSIQGDIILAGGGSMIPNMKESLEKLLDRTLVTLDDPVYSNARGLEKLAIDAIKKAGITEAVQSTPQIETAAPEKEKIQVSGQGTVTQEEKVPESAKQGTSQA